MKQALIITALTLAAAGAFAAESFGDADAEARSVALLDLLQDPEAYLGETIRIEGRIDGVCPKMGCWLDIAEPDGERTIRFKVQDGQMVFPVELAGRDVEAVGVVQKIELEGERAVAYARHQAEEFGKEFDPADAPERIAYYRLFGKGAKVAD